MNRLRKILNTRYVLIFFLIVVVAWFYVWALHISIVPSSRLGGPDEGLRYLVPKFIFDNWQLPTGYDQATIHSIGYWSYAFYPQVLGPLVSAVFMSITAILNSSPETLVYAARMASILFGTVAVLFMGRSVEKLFQGDKNAKIYAYVAMILFAAWPQVAFLASYVNNDIVGLCGVSVLAYACISGYKDHWNLKNANYLSAGLIVCLLGYTNSYGFVLFGFIFFALSIWWQSKPKKQALRIMSIVVLSVALLAGPFFVRNMIIYKGDMFGVNSFQKRTLAWEAKTGIEVQRSYSEMTNRGIVDLALSEGYLRTMTESVVARFGKMTVIPSNKYIYVYRAFVAVGIAGCLFAAALLLYRNIRRTKKLSEAIKAIVGVRQKLLLLICVLAASITTIALSLYYSYTIDYQAQGRYIIYLIIPIIITSVWGFKFLIDEIIVEKYRFAIGSVLLSVYVGVSLFIYYKYIYILTTL